MIHVLDHLFVKGVNDLLIFIVVLEKNSRVINGFRHIAQKYMQHNVHILCLKYNILAVYPQRDHVRI